MRLLHGQNVLEDDQGLQHLELGQKSKLQMIIEQAEDIPLTIRLPVKNEVATFKNCTTIRQIIQLMVDKNCITSPSQNCCLLYDNKELDHDMPLHWYNIQEGSVLNLERQNIGLKIFDESGDTLYVVADRKSSKVIDIKQNIADNVKYYDIQLTAGKYSESGDYKMPAPVKVYENIKQMHLYIKNDKMYNLLEDDKTVSHYNVKQNTTLYLVYYDWVGEYRSAKRETKFNLYLGGNLNDDKTEYIGWQSVTSLEIISPSAASVTLLSMLLRIQEQYNIPIHAMLFSWGPRNHRVIVDKATPDQLKFGRASNITERRIGKIGTISTYIHFTTMTINNNRYENLLERKCQDSCYHIILNEC